MALLSMVGWLVPVWLAAQPAAPGGRPVAPDSSPRAGRPELTRPDLEAWLDGYLPGALERNDMAGAVVVVVKGGEILLAKGYGYADVAARRRVDPERTVFPLASISKTFTATAVMQLVEQGKLDLDRDINTYLDFPIPAAFGQPITLRHLLTHTAGFDDLQKGSSPADLEWFPPLEVYLKRRSPNRIFPPGDTPAYSNYGMALAAYLVQRVAGEPIEAYLDRRLFRPLGMTRTSAYQPTPPGLMPDRVKAYLVGSGPVQRTEFTSTRGAGGIVSTGADMARWMIAHLHDGRLGETEILGLETARRMHSRTISPVEHINGMAIGFFQEDRNGERIIGHDGDTKGVHSNLKLLLDRDVGFFADFNASGRGNAVYQLRDAIFEDFVDRYFPAPVPDEPAVLTAREHSRMMAGSYQASRRLNGVLSVFMMLNGLEVSANSDGTITLPKPPTGRLTTYREVGPFLWRERGGKGLLEARVVGGRVISLHDHPVGVLIKVPLWKSARLNLPLLLIATLVLLGTLIAWPVSAWFRRRSGSPSSIPLTRSDRVARRLARIGAVAMVLFLAGWVTLAFTLTTRFYLFNSGLDPWIRLLHLVGLIGVVGAVAAVFCFWRSVRPGHRWPARLGNFLLASAMVWLVWFIVAFNLITMSLEY
jgi:CubicO group peptidase (beta-lactamase class C family)